MRMEILPQIANSVLPSTQLQQQQQERSRCCLAVEFWQNSDGRQNFANLSLGCSTRLLQTALLKGSGDVKKIILNCFGPEEATFPRVLVTNRPKELAEIDMGEFIIVPCFFTSLASAVAVSHSLLYN